MKMKLNKMQLNALSDEIINKIKQTKTGPLYQSIGFSMKEGWTNPNKDDLMKKAGFFKVKSNANKIHKSSK